MNLKSLFSAVAMAALVACGGGGSTTNSNGGGTPTPTPIPTFPGKFRVNTVKTAAMAADQVLPAAYSEAPQTLAGQYPTQNLHYARIGHQNVFLPDGKILIVGGRTSGTFGSETLEYFNPTDELFYQLPTNLKYGRDGVTAKLMGDGQVYMIGGVTALGGQAFPISDQDLVEVLDPNTGTIVSKHCGFAPVSHYTVGFKINDNEIFFIGGVRSLGSRTNGYLNTTNVNPTIVNIRDMSWREISTDSKYHIANFGFTQTANGDVYIAGGRDLTYGNMQTTISKFSASTKTWTDIGNLPVGCMNPCLTALKDGNVLIAGGADINTAAQVSGIYLLNATTNTLTKDAEMPQARSSMIGSQLPNGRILMAGGNNAGYAVNEQLVYDPTTHTCGYSGKMITTRQGHAMSVLPTGRILITGGYGNPNSNQNDIQASAEIFEPEANVYITFDTLVIPGGASYKFSAEYKGTVTWSCDQGTIDSLGNWTAPWEFTKPTVTITATSTTDSTKFAYCFMTISDPKNVIKIQDPGVVTLNTPTQLTYTVFYIKPTTVVWTVTKVDGTSTTDATVSVDGLFTATKAGTYMVTATSTVDTRYNNTISIVVQ